MVSDRRQLGRVAILSFHSHSDRSFLDDRELALVSGDLRADGIDNDLVVVAFGAGEESDRATERALVERLGAYDAIVFERVWSPDLVARIRVALPGRPFIHCRGEHVLDDPPADYVCGAGFRQTLPRLLRHLSGDATVPPGSVQHRVAGEWVPMPGPPMLSRPESRPFSPNLAPVYVNAGALPTARTFSVQGNLGCPYQADARENPAYAGARIPAGLGRGCAFCTTGNHFMGRPTPVIAASVLEQLRYLRTHAPDLRRIVLKDQNPFAYLAEVVDTVAKEGLGGFTLMLETRADWFLKSEGRLERAVEAASSGDIRISPFLVGIENFSQPELDRYNKGTTAEANIAFLERLWELSARYGEALDLESASFGFVLFSPWTTLDDLETNLRAIERTRFDRLRGRVLLSRARLYPDTALYYLAERDGVFAGAHEDGQDASRRYGYYPARPWRFQHDDVAHFAALATQLVAETGGTDEIRLFAAMLEAFADATDFRAVDSKVILEQMPTHGAAPRVARPAPTDLRARFARLVRPLNLDESFAGGWAVTQLAVDESGVSVELGHDRHEQVILEIAPRGTGPHFARSRHYDMRHQNHSLSVEQRDAVQALCNAIVNNDR